jgi:hypothetical protein
LQRAWRLDGRGVAPGLLIARKADQPEMEVAEVVVRGGDRIGVHRRRRRDGVGSGCPDGNLEVADTCIRHRARHFRGPRRNSRATSWEGLTLRPSPSPASPPGVVLRSSKNNSSAKIYPLQEKPLDLKSVTAR